VLCWRTTKSVAGAAMAPVMATAAVMMEVNETILIESAVQMW
jgi:hypothetical protein